MVQHESTIFAPMFWGFVLSIFLGGMTIIQAHVYFPAKRDRPLIRWTAGFMVALDLTSSILVAYSVYYYLIPEFGSFERFGAVTPQFSAECLITSIIALISQLYFVHQLVIVKRAGKGSWVVIGLIVSFAILAAVGGIGCVTSMYVWDTAVLAQRAKSFTVFFALAKGFAAITDVIATIAMCMFLTGQKGGIEKTNNLLSQVMLFVIQRGILVTLIQVALLIAFFAAPGNLAWLALHMNVTRLYANTFFAMLNGRAHLRDKHTGTVITTVNSGNRSGIESHRQDNINLDDHHHFGSRGVTSFTTSYPEADNSGWLPEKAIIGVEGDPHSTRPLPMVTKTVIVSEI